MVLLLQRAELWPDSAVRRPKTQVDREVQALVCHPGAGEGGSSSCGSEKFRRTDCV